MLSELGGSKAGRMAALHAGLPPITAFATVNRACASSLTAISTIATSILSGQIDAGIAGGMESMTRNYGSRAIPTQLGDGLKNSPSKDARDCIMSMGLTAENVAKRAGVSREAQDAYASRSQTRAVDAQSSGRFDEEIVPVPTTWTDPKDESKPPQALTVTKDDGVRATTLEKLAGMKPAFDPENGTATAGNSSQISDGAAALTMMRRGTAQALGLSGSILGKWAGSTVVGVAPDEMGIGPALAVPALLQKAVVKTEEIGLWEINEAFAAQVVYCIRKLSLNEEIVNVNGGAIALGHPLGATGARLVTTLLGEMGRRGVEVGCASLCIGTGMGQATLIVRE